MKVRICLLGLLTMMLVGCRGDRIYIVGVQEETSRAIMAEMLAETLRGGGLRVLPVPCGDLRSCAQMLRAGEVDLVPGYSGDVVALTRRRTNHGIADLEEARRAFALLDIKLSPSFGIEAPFRIVMRVDHASELGVTTIDALANVQGGVRFAVPEGYVNRPGDGLYALSRRYGLASAPGGPVTIENASDRVAEVLSGAVDATVIRDFGYDLSAFGLVALEDNLGFFPRYWAATLIGPSAGTAEEDLLAAMAPLTGRLKGADMAALMLDVLVQGWTPAHAARRLLVTKGIADELGPGIEQPPIVLALDPRDEFGAYRETAARVVSRAFAERPVAFREAVDPLGALSGGRAEIALVDAAEFFRFGRGGPFGARDTRAEAAAVVGDRRFYLLRPAQTGAGDPFTGAIGAQPHGSTGSRLATALLSDLAHEVSTHAPLETLLELLAAGDLDAALVLASARPTRIMEAVQTGRVRVESLTPHVTNVPLFLIDARIPAGSFHGQEEPIDTFSMQLLLAGAAPRTGYTLRSGGPASAILTAGQPLTQPEAEALVRASPTEERPDPILQSVWARTPTRAEAERELLADTFDTALNIGIFAFVAWVALLLVRGYRS